MSDLVRFVWKIIDPKQRIRRFLRRDTRVYAARRPHLLAHGEREAGAENVYSTACSSTVRLSAVKKSTIGKDL